MGGCATKENKENKPKEGSDGCVWRPANPASAAIIHFYYYYLPSICTYRIIIFATIPFIHSTVSSLLSRD